MKTFTFYEYRQVKMYTKDTFEIEAESMDEAKKKLRDILENRDSFDINIDPAFDYESVEDIPNTQEYYNEEHEDITKEIK